MPDREQRFSALLDVVDAVTGGQPMRVLDLAGGPGSLSLRVRQRFPDVVTTVVDIDPVLLAIARASLPGGASVVSADLSDPDWLAALPHREYDAVLTATALHWFPAERVAEIYAEAWQVLRPGGVFANVDHIIDDGLPSLAERLEQRARERRHARWAAGAVLSWQGWWEHVANDPVLGPLAAERAKIFEIEHRSSESFPPLSWHLTALRSAGFTEVGSVWRGGAEGAVAGVR